MRNQMLKIPLFDFNERTFEIDTLSIFLQSGRYLRTKTSIHISPSTYPFKQFTDGNQQLCNYQFIHFPAGRWVLFYCYVPYRKISFPVDKVKTEHHF